MRFDTRADWVQNVEGGRFIYLTILYFILVYLHLNVSSHTGANFLKCFIRLCSPFIRVFVVWQELLRCNERKEKVCFFEFCDGPFFKFHYFQPSQPLNSWEFARWSVQKTSLMDDRPIIWVRIFYTLTPWKMLQIMSQVLRLFLSILDVQL